MSSKSPQILTPEQRLLYTTIPDDLSNEEMAHYFTLSDEDKDFIQKHRKPANKLGVAVQLCTLRFPGRFYLQMTAIAERFVVFIAEQLDLPPTALVKYGKRQETPYNHLAKIRRHYGYRACTSADTWTLMRFLLPLAMENEASLPVVDAAMAWIRQHKLIAPPILTTERQVWHVQRMAQWRIHRRINGQLSTEQKKFLAELLQVDSEKGNKTPLAWLQRSSGKPSSDGMYHLVERITFLNTLDLPSRPDNIHPVRYRQLAQRGERYRPQALANLKNPAERNGLLLAFLHQQQVQLIDQLVDMFDRWLTDLMRRGRNKQKVGLHRHITRFNRDLNTMTQAITAFLEAKKNEQDPFETVFAVVSEEKLTETVASAILYTRPPDMDFRDLVENTFIRRRKAMLAMMRTLIFTPVQENNAGLEALQHVLLLLDDHDIRVRVEELVIDGEVVVTPMAHLKRLRWKRHTVIPEGINPNYYELAAFDRLRSGLRAGDIAVVGSHRYQAFADYLFPLPEWEQLKKEKQTRLALADDPKTYLDECQKEIVSLLEQLGKVIAETDSHLSFDKEGILHLTRLTKATPSEAEVLRQHLYSYIPLVEFAQLIADVHEWTDVFSEFPHLLTGEIPTGEQQAKLIATLMAVGMNIGLSKMAQASNFTEDELRYFAEWHIRDETIRAALVKLDNFVLHHPFSRHWGDGTTSSSDGMRVPVTVNSPNAVHNARYFWYRRGVTIVAHAADIWMPFYPQVMQDTSEALYVIDALCHHETDFDIQEHYTDTGGATYHVFALCRMLGFRFMPRIRGITKQYLYSVSPVTDLDETLENLIKGQVDEEMVVDNWADMRRMSASIRHGRVTASLMMRKLSAYPKQNQLAQALKEVGKLERTIFSLKYLLDQTTQRRTLRGLNKGEAIWSAAQALDIMQGGELTDRAFSDQMNRASSRMLLVSMLSAWNTVYLDSVVKELRAKGETVPNEYLTHVSPLGWQHVNLLGRYEFDFKQTYPLHALRPLRKSI